VQLPRSECLEEVLQAAWDNNPSLRQRFGRAQLRLGWLCDHPGHWRRGDVVSHAQAHSTLGELGLQGGEAVLVEVVSPLGPLGGKLI
jgi:hypothetical protein